MCQYVPLSGSDSQLIFYGWVYSYGAIFLVKEKIKNKFLALSAYVMKRHYLVEQQLIRNTLPLSLSTKKSKEEDFFQVKLKIISDESLSPEKDHFLLKGQNFKCQCLIILVNGTLT